MQHYIITFFSVTCLVFGFISGKAALSINTIRNQTVITLDSQTHLDYGLAYPVTYDIPNLNRKFISEEPWYRIEEKTSNDFFNGIESAI